MNAVWQPTRIAVVAGLIADAQGRYLLNQRQKHQQHPLLWEFPGGKVEAEETLQQTLVRELHEELGISAKTMTWYTERDWDYAESRIRIAFFLVEQFSGTAIGKEGQNIAWFHPEEMLELQVPEANLAIIHSL